LPAYGNEPETKGRRNDVTIAAIVLVLAASTSFLVEANQQRIASSLQATIMRPFIATQERLNESRLRAVHVDSLTTELDALSAILSTQSALVDENRTLRGLLDLTERAGQRYLPATVLRPGTPGSESMFIVDVGSADGISQGSPVVSPNGLVGVIREVRPANAVGMDWSHPDFRASAMLADGSTYGMVEARRGRFREEDRLVLNGVAFNQRIAEGITVLTSGLGGVFPRGVPIGRIDGLADSEGTWRKSYWLTPLVEPGSATYVVVLIGEEGLDVSAVWPTEPLAVPDSTGRGPGR
jgi:cell shape-determining protein MreC